MAKKPVKYYVVNAFTESPFRGNPAAVCLLEHEDERDVEWLRAVAAEFNLPMTCFLTRVDQTSQPRFKLRWFTTVVEVPLCGHATLAAAHTLFTEGLVNSDLVEFDTLSDILTAKKVLQDCNLTTNIATIQNGEIQDKFLIELNLHGLSTVEYNSTEVSAISQALGGVMIVEIKKTTVTDCLLVLLPSGKCVEELQPKIDAILNIPDGSGIIVTGIAPRESKFDFYTRFFTTRKQQISDGIFRR